MAYTFQRVFRNWMFHYAEFIGTPSGSVSHSLLLLPPYKGCWPPDNTLQALPAPPALHYHGPGALLSCATANGKTQLEQCQSNLLACSTTLSLCQTLNSPLLLPAGKIRQSVFSKPLHSLAGTALKGTRLFSEGEHQVPRCRKCWPMNGLWRTRLLSYRGSANEVWTAGISPQDGGTWPLPLQPWSPGQRGRCSSPAQHLHFHSTTRSSSRIPAPKQQPNSLNEWSKHSRLMISCEEQAQESTLAYHHTEMWPTSPACHWQACFLLFSALHVGLFLVKRSQLESATVSSKLWAGKT